MKKYAALIALVLAVLFVAAGCGKKPNQDVDPASDAPAASTASADREEEQEKANVAFEKEDEYVVFNASLDFELEEDAWLGVIPTGTIYENEADADEVDLVYVHCCNLNADGAVSHRFEFEKEYFNSIEDGIYDLVLCSSDNGEIGKVLLQIGLEKNGENIVLDFENKK